MNIILDRLKDIVSAVMYAAEAVELEEVLERIAHVSREIAGARYAALGVPDQEGGLKYFKYSGISAEAADQISHLPKGTGLLGAIMRERKAIRLESMAEDKRSAGFCGGHPHMTSLLGVPILIGQQLFGVLYLCDREDGKPFDNHDQWLIETMAGYAALAIAGAELRQQQSRLKLLEERERIGMELHDGVIQSLYAIGMHLDLIRSDGMVQPTQLDPIIGGLNDVIEDIRRYIMNLRSTEERNRTVQQQLSDMLGRLHVPESLTIDLKAPDQKPPFSAAAFEGVCLIVNEAVSNAVRHADASMINIRAWQEENRFMLKIADDGRGFNVDEIQNQAGLGLRNMQQRAHMYGGQVEIQTAPNLGTTLTIRIPIGA